MCKRYLPYIPFRPLKINFYTALQIMITEHFVQKCSLSRKPVSIYILFYTPYNFLSSEF